MECNKDEAARAKYIAERRFMAKDITGAKKFALKAQNLYPELDGISQLLATLEIYLYSENKINGENDWYGILGVNPQDDVDVIRKQYRKLALIHHPDKNKAKGADGAFNLISQAWNLLSDKPKRSAYDKLLHIQPQCDGSSVPPGQNGFYNFVRGSNMEAPKDKSNTVPSASHKKPAPVPSDKEKPPFSSASHKHESSKVPSSHKQKPPNAPVKTNKRKRVPTVPDLPQEPNQTTFWTACHGCKMQYEYPRMYINRNLLCPNCREPFFSFEIAPPPPAKRETLAHHQKVHKSNASGLNTTAGSTTKSGRSGDSVNHDKFQWAPFSKTAGAASAAQAASMVQHAYEKAKREREEANIATKRDEALRKKKRASNIMSNSGSDMKSNGEERRINMDDLGIDSKTSKQVKVCKSMKSSRSRDVSNVQCLHLLTKKAKNEICKRIYEWNSAAVTKSVDSNVTLREKADEKKNGKNNPVINGGIQSDNSQTLQSLDENHASKYTLDALYVNFDKIPMSVEVPDSDFHNFGKYRSENCLEENQVWAAYDNNDGMPRYYGMIHRVFCLNPFKVQINWLNYRTNNELGGLSCIGFNYSKACGDFSLGKQQIIDSVGYLSHKVKWTKGSRGCVQIYPRVGEVWCVYKNWCPEWNELTAYEVVHEYDIVQVLEEDDNNEGGGAVAVIPLVKVVGFKSVFRPHLDLKKIHKIPKEEYLRFSHYIPSYLIKGREDFRGCLELDPAATPPQLLHVIAGYDFIDAEIMEREDEK